MYWIRLVLVRPAASLMLYWNVWFRNVCNVVLKIFISCKQYAVYEICISVVRNGNRVFYLCLKWHSVNYQICKYPEISRFVRHSLLSRMHCVRIVCATSCLVVRVDSVTACSSSLALSGTLKIPFTRTLLHGVTPNMTETADLLFEPTNVFSPLIINIRK